MLEDFKSGVMITSGLCWVDQSESSPLYTLSEYANVEHEVFASCYLFKHNL